MYYIGIDLGGTNIAVGLVSEDGKILRKAETPTLAKRPYADIVPTSTALTLPGIRWTRRS